MVPPALTSPERPAAPVRGDGEQEVQEQKTFLDCQDSQTLQLCQSLMGSELLSVNTRKQHRHKPPRAGICGVPFQLPPMSEPPLRPVTPRS